MGHEDSVFAQTWPTYDEEAMKEDEVEIVVQINGKVKGKLVIGAEEDKRFLFLRKLRKFLEIN